MEKIKLQLKARENYLQNLKKEKEKALAYAPEGLLRIQNKGNQVQYYLRNDPKDFSGVYIPVKQLPLARALAQKGYDKKVLNAVEKELAAIQKYYLACPDIGAEEIYERLHKNRQALITPILETESEFVHKWVSYNYTKKNFTEGTPEFYTAKGETVRSKSELIIADLLYKEGIPYRYECSIHLKGMGKIHPDFTVLNIAQRKELYWEHLGMMDNPDYAENALQRIACYEQNGIFPGEKLILTYETKKTPVQQKLLKMMIEKYLK